MNTWIIIAIIICATALLIFGAIVAGYIFIFKSIFKMFKRVWEDKE